MAQVITPGGRVGNDASLDRSPKQNWIEKTPQGQLPQYVRIVANGLMKTGHPRSRAIAMAIAAIKRWAAGRGNVRPQVQAAAAKALAQWEAMKATTASGVETDEFNEVDLPIDIDRFAILDDEESPMQLHDGLYEEVVDDAQELASTLLAGAAPLHPPKDWFEDPKLNGPTPLTITADGRVFGHIAAWNVDHIGIPGSRKPPRSASNYAFFKTGVLTTADGDDVPVGQITSVGGHAPLNADAGSAVRHYDDTASAFADVNAGEDAYGIWVAGAARPGVTEEQIRAIRASAPSGDWRPINGNLELVACCQVNVPGFPVVRSMVAGGEIQSLVAAGAAPLYALRQEQALVASIQAMEDRMTRMQDDITRMGLVAAGKKPPFVKDDEDVEEPEAKDDDKKSEPAMTPLERMKARREDAKRMSILERKKNLQKA